MSSGFSTTASNRRGGGKSGEFSEPSAIILPKTLKLIVMPADSGSAPRSFDRSPRKFDTPLAAVVCLYALVFWGVRWRYWSLTSEAPFSDIYNYFAIGQQIAERFFFGYSDHYYSFWTPVTPTFIAIALLLGGDHHESVFRILVQSITFLGSLALAYELAKLTGRRWLGFALLFIVATCRPSIFWSLKLGTEAVSEALLLSSIALVLRTARTGSAATAAFAGVVCLLLALNRPQFFPSIFLVAGFFALGAVRLGRKPDESPSGDDSTPRRWGMKVPSWFGPDALGHRRRFLPAACFVLAIMIAWSPWIIRNYLHYGAFVPVGTSGFDAFIWEYGGAPIKPGRYQELAIGDGKVLREFGLENIQEGLRKLPNDLEHWKTVRVIAIAWLRANWVDLPRLMVWRLKGYITHNGADGLTKVSREDLFLRGPSSYKNPAGEVSLLNALLLDKTPWSVFLALGGTVLLMMRSWVPGGVIVSLWLVPWFVLSLLISYERTVESLISFTLWLALYLIVETTLLLSGHPGREKSKAPLDKRRFEGQLGETATAKPIA